MNDDQAGRVMEAVLNLAVVVRDEGADSVVHAAREILHAAGGDAIAALTVAAALIHVDIPVDTWWEPLTQPEQPVLPIHIAEQPPEPKPPRPLSPCGTHAAFNRHKLRKESIDDACIIAERAYQRARYVNAHGHRAVASGAPSARVA